MSRLGALLVILAAALGCEPRPLPTLEVAGNTARLAVTDAALLEALDSFTAVLFRNQVGQRPCADLMQMSVAELRAAEPVVDIPLPRDDVDVGVVFGAIRAGGVHSFLILGHDGSGETPVTLANAEGKVVAVGCEELEVIQDQRRAIAITLFPAGLR